MSCWRRSAGGVVALLDPRFTAYEMAHPLADTGAGLVVTEPALAHLLETAASANPKLKIFSTEPTDGCSLLESLASCSGPVPAVSAGPDDVALLSYTSGTTGVPKGALLTHGSLRATASSMVVARGITWRDPLFIAIPLSFAGGMCYYIREGLLVGATTVLAAEPDAGRLLELIETERVASWGAVNGTSR